MYFYLSLFFGTTYKYTRGCPCCTRTIKVEQPTPVGNPKGQPKNVNHRPTEPLNLCRREYCAYAITIVVVSLTPNGNLGAMNRINNEYAVLTSSFSKTIATRTNDNVHRRIRTAWLGTRRENIAAQ
uniref:Uncharacterized protein n=1 Tax=Sipha flava TaxID=143950 RepID=A0A2S2QUP3_9HEMI